MNTLIEQEMKEFEEERWDLKFCCGGDFCEPWEHEEIKNEIKAFIRRAMEESYKEGYKDGFGADIDSDPAGGAFTHTAEQILAPDAYVLKKIEVKVKPIK